MIYLLKAILQGSISYLPGGGQFLTRDSKKRSTQSARYCYTVWLRHLVKLHQSSGKSDFPCVVEFGPGSSISTGLAAILTGTDSYVALDVFDLTKGFNYESTLDELIKLFRNRTPIPGEDEFPNVKPKLNDYSFPELILTDCLLEKTLHNDRLATIKSILNEYHKGKRAVSLNGISIQFVDSWETNANDLPVGSADLVISQAVLMMVKNLESTYRAIGKILKKGGISSHQIDFKSFNTASKWNGHWTYSDFLWKLILGKRPFLINREPYSVHAMLHEKFGLKIIETQKVFFKNEIPKYRLTNRFRNMPDEDLITRGALIQAVKE